MHNQSPKIVVIVQDMRSVHNVGSLLRTAEGLGVTKVYLCGYTPHPSYLDDPRLPHQAARQTAQISKTALGAEKSDIWEYRAKISQVISQLQEDGYKVMALEQSAKATSLPDFQPPEQVAIVLGREVEGLETRIIALCDGTLEIPMFGQKESFNVVEAATMAIYHCRFIR